MSRSSPRRNGGASSISALGLVVGGLVLMGVGALLMSVLAPAPPPVQPAVAPGSGGLPPDVGAALAKLSAEIADLRATVTHSRDLRPPTTAPGADDGLRELREELASVREASARVPVGGEVGSAEAIEARLLAIENLMRSHMLVLDKSASRGSVLHVPPGEPDRAAILALQLKRESDGGEEETTRTHRLWTFQQVLDKYGRPDEVTPHEDYVEWIYYLPDHGDNFDFHFVDGMCVIAH